LRPLSTSAQQLQLVPQPPLPEMPEYGAGRMGNATRFFDCTGSVLLVHDRPG
jgi:hypothetical protein